MLLRSGNEQIPIDYSLRFAIARKTIVFTADFINTEGAMRLKPDGRRDQDAKYRLPNDFIWIFMCSQWLYNGIHVFSLHF